jgi:hypothetical protein
MEQAAVGGAQHGLIVDRLDHTDVSLNDFYHGATESVSVQVIGGPGRSQGAGVEGRVAVFGGGSGGCALAYDVLRGGSLLVQDMWYEGAPFPFMRLTDVRLFRVRASNGRVSIKLTGSNAPPTFTPLPTDIVNEGDTLVLTNTASDPDLPYNTLTFSLTPGAPAGLELNPTNGILRWTPAEAQGLSSNHFGVVVTDDGSPPMSATNLVTVIVKEVNSPPALVAVGDRMLDENTELAITILATDTDIPAQDLTFSLGPGAPEGAAIHPTTGVFTWTPNEAQGPASYPITIRVSDDGSPSLSAEETIIITVREVNDPPAVKLIAPPESSQFIAPASIQLAAVASDVDGTISKVQFFANGKNLGESFVPPFSFAWTNASAGAYTLVAKATDNRGAEAASSPLIPTVLASLKSARLRDDGQFELTLHGEPGREYWVEASQDLRQWTPVSTNQVDPTGKLEFVDAEAPHFSERFYRARR